MAIMTALAFSPASAADEVTYFCTSQQRCWSDGKCEEFETRLFVETGSDPKMFLTRWPDRNSPNTLGYRATEPDHRALIAGITGGPADGQPYAATFQIFEDMTFLRTSFSLITSEEKKSTFGFAQQGMCERVEN